MFILIQGELAQFVGAVSSNLKLLITFGSYSLDSFQLLFFILFLERLGRVGGFQESEEKRRKRKGKGFLMVK